MALTDFLKGLFSSKDVKNTSKLQFSSEQDGLLLSLPAETYKAALNGNGDELSLHQCLRMQILLEQGIAEERPHGVWMSADDCASLDEDTRFIFDLPAVWNGAMRLQVTGTSRRSDFKLQLQLQTADGEWLRHYQLEGPLLRISSSEVFLPNELQWQALSAVAKHQALSPEQRDEYANLSAIHQLIEAANIGLNLSCANFSDFATARPERVGLAVELQPDGSLELQPNFGLDLAQEEVNARLGQLNPDGSAQSLRIGKTIVLLDEERLAAAHEIIQKRHILASQRRQFFAAPGSYIDASLVSLDSGFSMRIKGVGPFQHAYFGETGSNEIEWFGPAGSGRDPFENFDLNTPLVEPESLEAVITDAALLLDFKEKLVDAREHNASVLRLEGHSINIADPQRVARAIEHLEQVLSNPADEEEDSGPIAIDIHLNDVEAEFGAEITPPDKGIQSTEELDFSFYNRQPFPHQIEGIRWMLALARNEGRPLGEDRRIEGALLADDMGLGKTYMSIVGMREIIMRMDTAKPVLVVAPLSLLENWKREIQETYKEEFFKRIVILQADGDLPKYRIDGMGVETKRRSVPKTAAAEPAPAATYDNPLDAIPPWEDIPEELLQAQAAAAAEAAATLAASSASATAPDTPEAAASEIAEADSASAVESEAEADHCDYDQEEEDFYPQCALKIGPEWGPDRLDLPHTMVLTTYQSLRDYQFSLACIPWSIAVFDEAQNIKSPNTLQTRAAKALNADFKLLVTGTPVENHLGEFWCLFDTLQPGYLGAYQDFRQNYIKPILKATPDEVGEVREEVGKQLRDRVGGFMLRRNKEDHLQNIPKKFIILGEDDGLGNWEFDERITQEMTGNQRLRYEEVVSNTLDSMESDNSGGGGGALYGLQQLRDVSLHPKLTSNELHLPLDAAAAQESFNGSGKLQILRRILDEVKEREEKILVFIVNKRLQEFISLSVSKIYGLPVPIINGATKAVTKNPNNPTRQSIIDRFQAKPGFGVLVISPVAAGVGLTITAANNVVHLERHWNPAKEAQATDRAYRIGQKKDVNVYIPILTHPDFDSFDVNLNRLLSSKTSLKDAIITQEEVMPADLINSGVFKKH